MYLFKITIEKGYSYEDRKVLYVTAKNIKIALELVEKFAVRSYWSKWKYLEIFCSHVIDLYQK